MSRRKKVQGRLRKLEKVIRDESGTVRRIMHISFLGLPREVRDTIYRHLLVPEPTLAYPIGTIDLFRRGPRHFTMSDAERTLRAQRIVNRQFLTESEEIFYSENVFITKWRSYGGIGHPIRQLLRTDIGRMRTIFVCRLGRPRGTYTHTPMAEVHIKPPAS